MHFLQAVNSDLSVLIVCNKTGGTIKGDIKKNLSDAFPAPRSDWGTISIPGKFSTRWIPHNTFVAALRS
jgi:hypothetical protein